MKRSDESRLIKVPDANAVAAVAGSSSSIGGISQPPNSVTVFSQRPPGVIEMPQQPGSLQPIPLTTHRSGVTVYRGDHSGVVATTLPPAAHTGVVTATPSPQLIVSQPVSAIKADSIGIPSAPLTLQYATAFPGGAQITASAAPQVVKGSGPIGVPVSSGVHGLPSGAAVHQLSTAPKVSNQPTVTFGGQATIRAISNPTSQNISGTPSTVNSAANSVASNSANFQRLKVEDALSYLDQVKDRFGNQPQVYNAFLDIMKEFKSQSIDTPGVIARVSNLFRDHPELIVGFNTFLPPGYKIEVRSSDTVSVSMPGSHGGTMQTIVHTPHGIHQMTPHGSGTLSTLTPATLPPQSSATMPQTNILRMPLPSIATPKGLTATPINAPKFSQQQHAVKIESNSALPGFNLGPNLSATPIQVSTQASTVQLTSPPVSQQATVLANTPHTAGVSSQPVEFNHAINYVNKIKNRFQLQPEVYKQFLEILHSYQKDQRAVKEGNRPPGPFLTEAEVYAQVASLFKNQEDLLAEFSQFLPEATGDGIRGTFSDGLSLKKSIGTVKNGMGAAAGPKGFASVGVGLKRPPSGVAHPPPKKHKVGVLRDVSLAEAGKFGSLNEFAFFDKVRKAVRSPEVYDNFLRCLVLFNQEVVSRSELIQLTAPFLSRHPELFKWFKEFVGYREGFNNGSGDQDLRRVGPDDVRHRTDSDRSVRDKVSEDSAMEIDYATCKRLGASYCALPKNFIQPSCSGRTQMCREVLNDTWVSFPSWSEDSQFVTSRKTQYEEAVYRTEDERFEFDVVLETNKDTIKVLECVQKKLSRMSPEEAARYKLDDSLGGTSTTIHQRAIRRIYGDKSSDIIEGLKRNPVVAVPLVLRRLRAKDEEWREVQKNFNKIWRDQNEKSYLKSLDHQCLMFKQSDVRNFRSKCLLNEIESIFDERHEQNEDSENADSRKGPHLRLTYDDFSVLEDVNSLLIHHVKRQTSIQKDDKQKIKLLLKHFLMDRFRQSRQEISDDEEEDSAKDEDSESGNGSAGKSARSERARKRKAKDDSAKNEAGAKTSSDDEKTNGENIEADVKVESKDGRRTPLHARDMAPDETYTLMMVNNNWYLFLRFHHILCERLLKMRTKAEAIVCEETREKKDRKDSTAIALKLKPKHEIDPEDYYTAFLDMVKNLLDGNIDSQSYEDSLREMFGIHAYISFTLDKVVGNAVRQLQYLVTDESCIDCYELFMAESKTGGAGGACGSAHERETSEIIYQKKAEKLLVDENCMKIILYHQSGLMTIELLDTESDTPDSDNDEIPKGKHLRYVQRFIAPGEDLSDECKRHLAAKPIFLPRCVRSFSRRAKKSLVATESTTKDSNHSTKLDQNERLVYNDDNLECMFNHKNNKILYIVNSENCFVRRKALLRASKCHKSVSLRKWNDFCRWHASWVRKNVTDSGHRDIERWFMGKSEDLVPNRTQKLTRSAQDKSPFHSYNKFSVHLLKSSLPL